MKHRWLTLTSCIALAACFTFFAQFHSGPPWSGAVQSSRLIHEGNATIQIDFAPGALDLPQQQVISWITNAAHAVATYYGRFPVARARVLVSPVSGERGVLQGTTWGGVGGFPGFTRMRLGQHTTEEDLAEDWTMTHELVHMAFPSLADEHHWLEEGLATYIEPIARVQAGSLSAEKIWGDMLRDMPKGEPDPTDRGLDRTHTWGSTYWGGALFCLVADVTIRQQTKNKKGLQDALRAIIAAGGTIDHDWEITRALEIGDRATGTSVLVDLYSHMGKSSSPVDLPDMWRRLGVSLTDGKVHFDNNAPLASIRQSITAPAAK